MNLDEITLVKTRLQSGVWEGVLTYSGDGSFTPNLFLFHLNNKVADIEVVNGDTSNQWLIRAPIPIETVSDGIQTFLIVESTTSESIGSFVVLAGESLQDDIRAEMDLLRAELDMLKKAFRRHCIETL